MGDFGTPCSGVVVLLCLKITDLLSIGILWCGVDWTGSELVSSRGFSEHGAKLSGSIKDGEFFDQLSDCKLLDLRTNNW